ncbi:UDP-N-acetylmuramoyl-tripeptide--D-alanyl-D-alanine ligase [Priestia koreensis]|uniref:UDP-N-acetylmuramoyl-tripeptide--D-alanyl-D- alanine ligase n=1 Tax=Priestia koreensis TaxID=284581 RepID=UPI001F5793FA|nr:UDP-N-acetylmuramoyl-tripeptide--D-alanyl-D-alanine ligase [Priestia koreensis]UNL85205.1 UDP-N-acetylmuramoyl-tripeptide--D-alanyl-D-alanine ligase [Priestia koreensis]
MIVRSMEEIQQMIPGSELVNGANITISGVSTDTRKIEKNNLFVPLVGDNFNGHRFVNTALENGAGAVLWARSEGEYPADTPVLLVDNTLEAMQQLAKSYLQQLSVKVVGVTGSNGKTTTKDMIEAILSTTYKVLKTEGNFNNHIGLPLTVFRLEEDTDIAILEMGMSARGEIELLSNIGTPDVAVITNIGESHLLDLGSRDGIAEAKLEIVKGLQQDGVLIYNGDEPLLTSRVPAMNLKTVTVGEGKELDYYPVSIEQTSSETKFVISKDADLTFTMPVLGKHNVHNALTAIAVGEQFNIPFETIAKGLKNLHLTNMRMEMVKGKDGLSIINDAYNASPTSMKAAIQLVQDLDGFNQKLVVLGDMLELGEDENKFHYEVGASLDPNKIDYVFVYGPLSQYLAQGAKQVFPEDRVLYFDDKELLAEKLASVVHPEDLVLIKASRGMKLEEIISNLMK